ncbi:hypothetical protein [Nocardia blacklockiae]|uniref:hypothetical protein n=1 Tax=Nocardia blacklockiae TaxID=480036 RepID=UPI001894D9E0|nr:hypothetical protein [Nocardia blacklockiae]MBF6172699.1 hypothetical protein [Nocardia blacklockiae]
MAAQRSAVPAQWLRRTGSLLVIGAVPVAAGLVVAGPAAADAPVVAVAPMDAAAPVAAGAPAVARDDIAASRPVPDGSLAPVDPGALRLPGLAAPPVAPIQAPEGAIRLGSTVVPRPDFVDPQAAAQVNDAAAQAEAALAQGLDSAGFAPSRSDRIAADTLGAAAAGAAVAAAVTSPVAATGALIGAVAGVVAGLPFAPAGLVVVPPIGAALGAAAITVPAAAVGAAIGAGIGALEGVLAPATIPADPTPDRAATTTSDTADQ